MRGITRKNLHLHLVLHTVQTPVGTSTSSGKEERPPKPDYLEIVTM